MSKEAPKYEVGQELWYQPHDKRDEGYVVKIEKIGREWLHVRFYGNIRKVHKERLYVDGERYSSPGDCYLTREALEEKRLLIKGWRNLADKMSKLWDVPAGVGFESIGKAAELLGLGE